MTALRPADRAARAALEKKATDVVILDLRQATDFTDYFVLASGTNERQVQAIADGIEDRLRQVGEKPLHTEGYRTAQWVLLDFADVVVHVFLEERRQFYGLERLWSDAPDVTADARPGPATERFSAKKRASATCCWAGALVSFATASAPRAR